MLATATTQLAPRRRELDFQLFDVLDVEALLRLPQFADHDRATLSGVLDTAYELGATATLTRLAALDDLIFTVRPEML